jgi:hypothetical protein
MPINLEQAMQAMEFLWDFWCELSFRIKGIVVLGVIGLIFGVPTGETGWIWRWTRQSVQIQNCMDDFTNPVMGAFERGDQKAIERALGSDRPHQLRACGSNALQHPEGTIAFFLGEYKRHSADARQ